MKRIISFIVCIILMMSVCITANAAGSSTLNGNSSVTVGSNIEFTVNVSGCSDATSIAVAVSYDGGFELVSGTWLKSGSITKFDTATNKGALGGLSSPDVNGNLFKLVLKAKTASASNQNVSVNVIAKNGSSEIMNVTPSKSVKIDCATHTYGAYSKVNDSQHKHTCTVCGHTETANHTWNGGSVTKTATCKETGVKTYTCTACNATKTETIAKTNSHNWSGYKVTKEPTCTAAGTQTRTCSVCGETESQSVPATGHSYGDWATTKEPTCKEKGVETRKCSKCSATETKDIAALGHKFSNPTVTKQPTCTETGIESGKCTRCGTETTNTLKATGHNFGSWKNDKDATCTEGGTQKRICSKCGAEETRNTDALGHDFENPTIVKEATISTTGLKEGKCKRCGETTSEVIPCSAKDENTGIVFEANEGVFAEGTQMTVEEIRTDNPTYESVKNILSEVTDTFTIYDISAVLNGAKVQPNGEVKVEFKIPDDYGIDVAVYYIADDGSYEKLESTISEDGKTVSAKLTHFSNYAVCKLGTSNSANTDVASEPTEQSTESNNTLWIIIAIVAVVLVAGAVVTVIVVRKKKNKE
ncbi:MAG: cohesin domain-containing protein [Acutalibacteraceae bacterium]|nr:cohesin domain-containing protein [Acutalibacteraceae bacterium]